MKHRFFSSDKGKPVLPMTACATAIGCGFFAISLLACGSPSIGQSAAPDTEDAETVAAFDAFLNRIFCEEVTSNTINLHYSLSHPESFGITDYEVTLGEFTEEAFAEENALAENYLKTLKEFDYHALSLEQQLTYDVLLQNLSLQLDGADSYLYDEPLRPSTGLQSELPILYEEYTFYDEGDISDYLELIAQTDEYFAQIIAFEQEKAAAGLFMSDFACDNVISQCEDFVADGKSHYLIETFNNRVDDFAGLSQQQREAYKLENERVVLEEVLPAYEALADAMTDLLGSGKNDKGLCYLPDGREFYENLVTYSTGYSGTIKSMQNLIANARATALSEAGDFINDDPELWDACNEVSLSNSDSTTTLNHLQEAMLSDFPAPPEVGFTVSYIDECVEEYMAPAFYITAPIDDYSNNSIYINESTDTSDITYFTTLAHEGYPGHLYQTVMSHEAGLAPVRYLLNYPGYVEGWATYTELQSYHYAGLSEPVASLLALNQSAMLSLYATTDLGIHYDGWSFDETLQFWNSYGITDKKAIRSIYELIVEEPAHYLKYYVGYLQFEKLKETASVKYLSFFDETAFHQAVLSIGPAPFDLVEKYLDKYYTYDGKKYPFLMQ